MGDTMPNRILKESICTSCEIDRLTTEEENLFYRLLVNCDDFGRMDARAPVLISKCYPLRIHKLDDEQVDTELQTLARVGLVTLYEINGKRYLFITNWEKHQQKRARHSKYPDPNGVKSSAINRNHPQSNVPETTRIENTRIENADIKRNQKKPKDNKRPYGEFQNVLLTDAEYNMLDARFGGPEAKNKIEVLSAAIESKGYKYKSHYAAILNWARRENGKARRGNQPLPRNEDYGDPPA